MFTCSECSARFEGYASKCTGCGAMYSLEDGARAAPVVATVGSNGSLVHRPRRERLRDDVPERPPMTSTGLPSVDAVLGGGIALGAACVYLVGGFPGSGKTTFAFKVADAIGETAYFALLSEGDRQRWDELGARTGLARDVDFIFVERLDDILAEVEASKPPLVIIDQLHAIEDEGGALAGGLMASLRRVIAMAQTTRSTFLLLAEREKAGGTIKGLGSMQHKVDCTMLFEQRGEVGSIPPNDTARRWMRTTKNRFALDDLHRSTELVLGPRGWEEPPPPKLDS